MTKPLVIDIPKEKTKKFRIQEYRPGSWRIYFSHQGKQIFLTSGLNGQPLHSEYDAKMAASYLALKGYNAREWGKDATFHFNVAVKNWIKLSSCGQDWLKERKRITEQLFVPFFNKLDIRDTKTINLKINEFKVHLKDKGLSDKYIKNVLGELKSFFRFNEKSIPELPEFKKIEVQKKPKRWLSRDAQEKVFQFIPKKHLPIFHFLRWYGTRLNEACGLKRENIFPEHQKPFFVVAGTIDKGGRFKETTKTKKIRVLPIIEETRWLFTPTEVTPFLFSHNGQPYTSKKLNRIWERANRKANAEFQVPLLNVYNSVRHSWACQRLNEGFPIGKVSAVLGHSGTQMTEDAYAEYVWENLADVITGKPAHSLLITPKISKLLDLQGRLVGGTGIEPATSGL